MTQLIPCPGCNRHVRQSENSCPFCSAALSLADVPEHALPRTRLGRAATFAFGATLVGAATLVACGGESEDGKKTGGGGSAGMASQAGTASGGSSAGTAIVGPVYGAPPFGGTGNGDGGTSNGAGMTSGGTLHVGGSGGPGPVYGAPSAGFSGVPLYGAAPAD